MPWGKTQNLQVASRCFGKSASTVNLDTIIKDGTNLHIFEVPIRASGGDMYTVDVSLGSCTCPQGSNGNACPHQAAVALKNPNFIPQSARERYKLAVLAMGDSPVLSVSRFVSLHQKEIEQNTDSISEITKEEEVPLETPNMVKERNACGNNIKTTKSETGNINGNADPMEQILKLHRQLSDDIEHKIRTGDSGFRTCYEKYLKVYQKIVMKSRGQ